MTLISILNANINPFNIFKATEEELVAKALDEAGLIREATLINGESAKRLCKSFEKKKENFKEATKLGNLLVKNNIITESQLQESLEYQKQNPQCKLGTILINFKFCTVDDIEKFLVTQIQIREDIHELEEFQKKVAKIREKTKNYNNLIK